MSQRFEIRLENRALLKKLTERPLNKSDQSSTTSCSLSKSNRKKYYQNYQLRIDNEGIYQRLRDAKPSYRTAQLAKQHRET